MRKNYRILDNGQGDATKPGPISSYTTREYPTRAQIAKAKTDKARRKPIKKSSLFARLKSHKAEQGYKTNQITKTHKYGPITYKTSGTYKGAGSKTKKKK